MAKSQGSLSWTKGAKSSRQKDGPVSQELGTRKQLSSRLVGRLKRTMASLGAHEDAIELIVTGPSPELPPASLKVLVDADATEDELGDSDIEDILESDAEDTPGTTPELTASPPTSRRSLADGSTVSIQRIFGSGSSRALIRRNDSRRGSSDPYLVLKVVNLTTDPYSKRMEIDALRRIWQHPHPNLVGKPDLDTATEPIWLSVQDGIMSILFQHYPIDLQDLAEYCGDRSLKSSTTFLQKVISDLVKGLCHTHNNGIILKNLNPENILIDATGNCIIGDFGSAYVLREQKRFKGSVTCIQRETSTLLDSDYCAPEVHMTERYSSDGLDRACIYQNSDFWSLGMCIHFLLTGNVFHIEYERVGDGWTIGNRGSEHQESMHRTIRELEAPCDENIREFFFKCSQIYPYDRIQGEGAIDWISNWTIDPYALVRALSEDIEFFHRKSRGPCSFLEGKPLVDPDTGEPTDVEVSTALERHLGLIVAHMPEHPAEPPTNQS